MSASQKKTLPLIFSSLKMALATFSSRLLGLVREQVMAATFGASGMTDAFTVAYRIPNMLRDLFAEGAFSSAFVPVFTEARLKDEQRARKLLWSLFVLLGLITGVISLLIIFFAPIVVDWVTSDSFTEDPERLQVTIQLVRVMAPFLTLVSLAALFMGALNSLKVFFVPSLAPAFFNIMMIASMLFLPPIVEEWGLHPIFCLGVGVVTGGLMQMLVQVPLILKKQFLPTFQISLISQESKKIMNRLGIGTIGIAANQVNIFVTTILATGTQLGAVSWLTYAFRLFQFPVGVLSVSIAGSNLVHFSDLWKEGNKKEAIEILKMSYSLSWLSLIPAFCLLYVLSDETVRLIFERGAFDVEDTFQTGKALQAYLIGLPFYGLYKIFAPTFFALDRPQVPVGISIFSIIANLIFCLLLVPYHGFEVLALGTSLSMALNCLLQVCFLRKELGLGLGFFLNRRVVKFFIAGIGCFLTTWLAKSYSLNWAEGFFGQAADYTFWVLLGVSAYLILLIVLGEARLAKRVLRR